MIHNIMIINKQIQHLATNIKSVKQKKLQLWLIFIISKNKNSFIQYTGNKTQEILPKFWIGEQIESVK